MNRIADIGSLALCALLVASAGCNTDPNTGYTTASHFRTGIETVCVPIWVRGKNVYRRGLEMRLTEALVKRIEHDTPYKVTTKPRADTQLTGTIDNIEQRVLSFNPNTGLAREMELTMVVSFTWTDLRDGQIIDQQKNFRVAGSYIEEDPLSEDFFQGSEDVVNKLAKRIVEQMEAPW